MTIETLLDEYASAIEGLEASQPMPDGYTIKRVEDARAAILRVFSEERSRARELWTALANLSFHCDGVVVTCPPPRTVYNQSFAVMDRFKPLYGPEAPKK